MDQRCSVFGWFFLKLDWCDRSLSLHRRKTSARPLGRALQKHRHTFCHLIDCRMIANIECICNTFVSTLKSLSFSAPWNAVREPTRCVRLPVTGHTDLGVAATSRHSALWGRNTTWKTYQDGRCSVIEILIHIHQRRSYQVVYWT